MLNLPVFSSDLPLRAVHAHPQGLVITDATQPDHPIVSVNPAACALTGYLPDELLGRNCRILQTAPAAQPGENDVARRQLRQALTAEQPAVVLLRNYRKNGEAFWNELTVYPLRDDRGRITHHAGQMKDASEHVILLDEVERARRGFAQSIATRTAELQLANEKLYHEILERRKAERALRAAERSFRGIFENAVEGIYQSSPDGRYINVNPALARLYGFTTPAAMLAHVGDIAQDVYVDPAMRTRFRELIERDGLVQNLEYQVRRRDGTIFWIVENARVARDRRGRVLYYEGMIQDVTARKTAEAEAARFEEQLRQSQKMQAIGTLAGGIAHDFNNIIGAIIGNTEMALDDVPPTTEPGRLLLETLTAAHRARDLVRQILAFSRREPPRRERVHLAPLIEEALSLLRVTFSAAIRVQVDVDTADDAVVADPGQMHQVLLNLGTNAAHAMRPQGGVLTVTLDRAAMDDPRPAGLPTGSYLRLAIRDTGHGMTEEVRQRVFEPFFTTKPVGEGTGLGLPVVHGIVGGHGGAITVDSAPGAGTTFTLWLPAAADDPAAAPI